TLILDSGVKKITLIGGEPTLWSHLFEFNKFCRNLGIKTLIVTNALRFSDDTFWERYKENPNDSAGISLKGHSKSSYKEIAGINDFDSLVSGLKRGLDFFQCGVHTVYSSPDPEGLVDTAKFAKEIGAKHLKIGFCKPTITKKGPDGSFMLPPSQVVNNVLNVYDEVSSIMEDRISFSMNLPLCLWPEEFLELLSSKKTNDNLVPITA
ncbi:radical SAM protein, partial [Patescibacteria group bacterium]|nr:radical SAM protein [Patescibacteria group bacterium]